MSDRRSRCGASIEEQVVVNPGDIIKWVYVQNGHHVAPIEELWATSMMGWMPIGSAGSSLIHVLVAIDDDQITWMNSDGTFSLCRRDGAYAMRRRGKWESVEAVVVISLDGEKL